MTNSKKMSYAKKMKISAIVLIALLVVLLISIIFKFQCGKYLGAIIHAAIGVCFVLSGYYGAKMQLEKGKNGSALFLMFLAGYVLSNVVDRILDLLF